MNIDRPVRFVIVAVLALLVLGYVGRACNGYVDRRILERETAAVDAAVAVWHAALDSVAHRYEDSLVVLTHALEQRTAERQAAVTTTDTVLSELPESVSNVTVRLRAALAAERAAHAAERRTLLARIDVLSRQVQDRDALLAGARERIAALTANRDAWQAAKTPGAFACVVGLGSSAGVNGVTAGASVTCGLKIGG